MSATKFILTSEEVATYYARQLPDLRQTGPGWWRGPCPLHEGDNENFKVNPKNGSWHCHSICNRGGSIVDFEMEFSKVNIETAQSNVLKFAGRKWKKSAEYIYTNKAGEPTFRVIRLERGQGSHGAKSFYIERCEDGDWFTGLGEAERVLYRLHELAIADYVFIVEGEKDCDTISDILNFAATTNPMGAGKWLPHFNVDLTGKHIAIIPDNDSKGRAHALDVASNLLSGATSVRIIELPNLPDKGDTTDWVNAGGTPEQLSDLWKKSQIIRDKAQLDALRSRWGLDVETLATDSGFNPRRLGQLLSQQKTSKDWLWKGRLVAGTVGILASKPKVGKSTMARNLALAVARGEPFLGWKVKRGPVLYVALEERAEDVVADFHSMGATESDDIKVEDRGGVQDVVGYLHKEKPALLVVDPLFLLVSVRDEKAYAETYSAMRPLINAAKETGTAILCLHHSSKLEKGDAIDSPIGSTALGGAVSTLFVMRRTERFRTLQTRQRNGQDLPPTILSFDSTTKLLSLGDSHADVLLGDVESQILKCLGTGVKTEPEIDQAVEGRNAHKRTALRDLLKEGKVVRTATGTRGDPYQYQRA